MPINYNKVENILRESMQRAKVDKLILSTDERIDQAKMMSLRDLGMRHESLILLIKWLAKRVENLPTVLEIEPKELKRLLGSTSDFSEEDWAKIMELEEICKSVKQQVEEKVGVQSDEDIIKAQKKEHIYKRFNVKKGWKPL